MVRVMRGAPFQIEGGSDVGFLPSIRNHGPYYSMGDPGSAQLYWGGGGVGYEEAEPEQLIYLPFRIVGAIEL